MSAALADWFAELRTPLDIPDFEPEIDDKDAKKDAALREQDAIDSGLIKKVLLRKSNSDNIPADGDLVYVHYNVKTAEDKLLQSTYSQEGGAGLPHPFIVGGGRRMPRAWEIAMLNSRVGEVMVLSVHPRYGFQHKDCGLAPPRDAPTNQTLRFTLELVQCFKKADVELIGGHDGMFKRTISRKEVWESPRAPFEVALAVKARLPAMDGSQCSTPPYFETPDGQPLRFTMGTGIVPPAIEEGLAAMTKGEHAVISCLRTDAAAPDGSSLVPSPPATSDRVEFELTLESMIQVRDMTGDGKVVKRRIRDGRGEFPVDCPIEDSSVRVHYRVIEPGSGTAVLDTRGSDGAGPAMEFQTGMAAVPEGLDMAVRLMTPGEVARVRAASSYAYDGRDDRPEGIAEGADVEWEVELLDFERQAHATHLSSDELIARGTQLKDQGNVVFRQGMVDHATTKWLKALKLLNQIFDVGGEEQRQVVDSTKAACMVNLALAAQRQENFSQALKWADKALREVPDHPKALWRRAAVRAFLGQLDDAEEDFRRVAEVDPTLSGDVDKEVARLRRREAAADRKQKQQWKGAFSRNN